MSQNEGQIQREDEDRFFFKDAFKGSLRLQGDGRSVLDILHLKDA